jgi:hypothetical protein
LRHSSIIRQIRSNVPLRMIAYGLRPGERLPDAVERLRHRLRECDADRRRVEAAPFPSADAKKRLRTQIEHLASRGEPDVSVLIEHDRDLQWPTTVQTLPLVGFGKDGSALFGDAQGEALDSIGLFCWLHRPALLKAIDALIDQQSDDGVALSAVDRVAKLAAIDVDALHVQRQLSALIWAQSDAEFPPEIASVPALLGLETRAA